VIKLLKKLLIGHIEVLPKVVPLPMQLMLKRRMYQEIIKIINLSKKELKFQLFNKNNQVLQENKKTGLTPLIQQLLHSRILGIQ